MDDATVLTLANIEFAATTALQEFDHRTTRAALSDIRCIAKEAAMRHPCATCDDTGVVHVSVVHATNPLLDTWESRPCGCRA